jgi:hypothetical protein
MVLFPPCSSIYTCVLGIELSRLFLTGHGFLQINLTPISTNTFVPWDYTSTPPSDEDQLRLMGSKEHLPT